MTVLRVDRDRPWLPRPHTCTVRLVTGPPPAALTTSAHLFGFSGRNVLMVRLGRGWDIPGGHIEAGETPETAVQREALEEGGVVIERPRLFAVKEILLECPKPPGWRYPYPRSYQGFFIAEIGEVAEFRRTPEVAERAFVAPARARRIAWIIENRELYEAALALTGP